MKRITMLICLMLMLAPLALLWCQDNSFLSNIFKLHTQKYDRSGIAIFASYGAMQNNGYRQQLDHYLTTYYDTDSTSHGIPRNWEAAQFGIEVPVQPNLKVGLLVDIYSTKYKMNVTHTGSDSVHGAFSYPQTEYAQDNIIVPGVGLKYWLVNKPGFAVTVMGEGGIPIARMSPVGYAENPGMRFDYFADGPKLGATVGVDTGTRSFSVVLSGGYVYLPMRFDNIYLEKAANFGGFKADLAFKTHF
jgi:hypothetical protein